jgi:hypothetical protein
MGLLMTLICECSDRGADSLLLPPVPCLKMSEHTSDDKSN